MIKKIIASGFLLCLFIAIPLSILGVKKVEAGTAFNAFINSLNSHYTGWKLDIPDIPSIPNFESNEWYALVVNFLNNIWNAIIGFLNILISLINYIINIIQFIATFLFEIGYMIGTLIAGGDYEYDWVWREYHPPVV